MQKCVGINVQESESVLVSERCTSIDDHFDFGARTPFLGLDTIGGLSLRFGQKMEVGIDLLSFVLVVMQTELVVMSGCVLPLVACLDAKQLEELVDLDLGVLAAEALSGAEKAIF